MKNDAGHYMHISIVHWVTNLFVVTLVLVANPQSPFFEYKCYDGDWGRELDKVVMLQKWFKSNQYKCNIALSGCYKAYKVAQRDRKLPGQATFVRLRCLKP